MLAQLQKLFDAVSTDFGLLRSAMRNSYKQHVAFRNKKSGACASSCVDVGGCFVAARISLLDDVDLTRAADRVDAMALAVVENVIGIAGDIDLRDNLARVRVEHDEFRGQTASDKQPMVGFIQTPLENFQMPDQFSTLSMTSPLSRSMTATCLASGTFTKIRLPCLFQLERFRDELRV